MYKNEETSKKSISFNHAGIGKLNYPVERGARGEGEKMKEEAEPVKGCGFIEERPRRPGSANDRL